MTRYISQGVPLTERQSEILDHLIEEASEVIHAASKLKRFGFGDQGPSQPHPNHIVLSLEVGDFLAMKDLATREGLLNSFAVYDGVERKTKRLAQYSKTLP